MMLCSSNKCTGCFACYSICPVNAILITKSEIGFNYPVIDSNVCINCGKCRSICPILNKDSNHYRDRSAPKYFAAWSNRKDIRANAATAGVVTSLGYNVIKQGGIVFGTRFEKKRLVFDSATSIKELLRFQGSKYVQADIKEVFFSVEEKLKEGTQVMFIGTPCQIHGLKRFLSIEYDNLLLVDLICHGVSSVDYLNEYLSFMSIDEYDNVVFRGKRGMSLVVSSKGDEKYNRIKFLDLFYTAYLKGLISRDSCYECPYASLKRYGDLTVGDFWGLEQSEIIPRLPFISLLIVNNKKGDSILRSFGDGLSYIERQENEAIRKNAQLTYPCPKHESRELFLDAYSRCGLGFVPSVKKTKLYRFFLYKSLSYRLLLFASKTKRFLFKR